MVNLNDFLESMANERYEIREQAAKMVIEHRKCRDPIKWNSGIKELRNLGVCANKLQRYTYKT